MAKVYPTLPRVAVRDSMNDDDLTDIDDEVFIRDGRNGSLKLDNDGGVKRPLMAPRRKCKKSCNLEAHRFPCKALLLPFCYGLVALLVLIGLIVLCIFTANIFPMPLTILRNWLFRNMKDIVNQTDIVPCTSLVSKVIWTRTLPKLTSEAPLRSNDVNSDGVDDIIVGFSTGLDTMHAQEYICALYFGSQMPCLGGVLALDGKTGETLWTHWTAHAIFSVDCGLDITNDKVKDCVISGRGGILHAINGQDGSSIWELPIQDFAATGTQRVLDVYDAKFSVDTDGDGVGDIITSHAMQSDGTRTSEVLIISGKSGNVVHSVMLPDTEQLFIAPQTLVHPDGENIFILATISQKQSGGLYIIPEVNLMYGDLRLRKLHHGTGKGALLPPILVDVTSDGVEDIIAAMFNSTIMAYNGLTFEPLWNYTVPNSEVISIPIPGYYNDDDVPDFMVKHQIGSGFPTYYYTVATIIDGRNGKSLLEKPMEDSLSRQISGLSITVDGFGNDWFLHWSTDCLNYEGVKEKYQFLRGQSLISQTRADLCKLRFNSTLTTKLLALSQQVGPPGIPLYFSEDWKSLEFNNSIDPRVEAEKYLDAHPGFEVMDTYADIPFVSSRIHKNYPKESMLNRKSSGLATKLNRYPMLTEVRYDDSNEYKARDKSSNMDFDVNGDSYNADESGKNEERWSRKKPPSGKEYNIVYDGDNNDNEEQNDEQEMDYRQEIREQRSDAADNVINDWEEGTNDRLSSNVDLDNESKSNDYYLFDTMNVTNASNVASDYRKLFNSEVTIAGSFNNQTNLKSKRDASNTTNKLTFPGKFSVTGNDQNDLRILVVDKIPVTQVPMSMSNKTEDDVVKTFQEAVNNHTQVTLGNYKLNPIPDTVLTINPRKRNVTNDMTMIYQKVSTVSGILSNISKPELRVNGTNKINRDLNIRAKNTLDEMHNKEIQGKSADVKWKLSKNQKMKDEDVQRKSKGATMNIGQDQTKARKKRTKRKTYSEQANTFDGVQRQPPTGILLPSVIKSEGKISIDLVFSTYWLPSSEISVILLQEDLDCIHRKKALSESKAQYKENDDIVSECLSERGVNYKLYQESMDRENVKIALGQMTIYRTKLECVCPEDMLPHQVCKNISGIQSWPEHLGSSGNGYFKPLRTTNA